MSDRALPSNVDAERLVLGAILTDTTAFLTVAETLDAEDFHLEKHRRIFARMKDLYDRGDTIERISVTNELMKHGQLESVGGFGYIISLDDGLPQIWNLEGYAEIVKESSRLRRQIFIYQSGIDRAMIAQESAQVIAAGVERQLLGSADEDARELQPTAEILEKTPGGLDRFFGGKAKADGLHTGFYKLDEMTCGMGPGDLILLAARPSHGKTALAMNIAYHVAHKANEPVAVFSLEMSKESLLLRMSAGAARVDLQKIRSGYINADERRRLQVAAYDISAAPLYIDDTATVTVMQIHAKLRRMKSRHGLGLAVVDYLQLMTGQRSKGGNRVEEVSYLSRHLKLIGRDLGIPMLVLSQLSRGPEQRTDKVPQLSDLRESGSLEQDADMVWFIYREELYKPDREDLRGMADVIIGKQRNGPIGRLRLCFIHAFTKFENMAADCEPELPYEQDVI